MAQRRITRRKASRPTRTRRSTARRTPVRTRSRRSYSTRKRASTSRATGGRTIRLELVQTAAPALSPVTQMLLEQGKVTMPRKAKF